MPWSDPNRIALRYVRWKAVLFGLPLVALGLLVLWIGAEAANPQWTAEVSRGQWLVDLPFWVRSPCMLSVAGIMLWSGGWMLWAGATNAVIVVMNADMVSARTSFGRLRQRPWSEITELKRKKNQLLLSPAGTDTLLQEIWDRRSVLIEAGMLEGGMARAESAVLKFRPDLSFRNVK